MWSSVRALDWSPACEQHTCQKASTLVKIPRLSRDSAACEDLTCNQNGPKFEMVLTCLGLFRGNTGQGAPSEAACLPHISTDSLSTVHTTTFATIDSNFKRIHETCAISSPNSAARCYNHVQQLSLSGYGTYWRSGEVH
jgi:hypothetical protein